MSPDDEQPDKGSSILSEQQASVVRLTVVVETLKESVEGLRADLKQRGAEQKEFSTKLTKLQTNVDNALRELKGLNTLVMRGNGQPSFQERLSKLETSDEGHEGEIQKLRTQFNARVHARELSRGQLLAGGLGIIAAIITSLVSAVAVIWRSGN